ncbi:hypothetical protein M2135_000692 [Parabacteroides sp. PF5-9]|nr:hypothetical protein [Parabacteroides sp. PF5-9]
MIMFLSFEIVWLVKHIQKGCIILHFDTAFFKAKTINFYFFITWVVDGTRNKQPTQSS